MTIWEITEDALDGLGLPLAASLFISDGELPDEFLVYSLVAATPAQHGDDVETSRLHRMQVSYYNRAGLAGMPDIDGAMTAAGFTKSQRAAIPLDQATRHFGLALEYIYLEEE